MFLWLSFLLLIICGSEIPPSYSIASNVVPKFLTINEAVADYLYIKKELNNLEKDLANLKRSLAETVSSNPTNACTRHTTPVQHYFNGVNTYEQLSAHDVRCPNTKVLTRFQMVTVTNGNTRQGTVHYEYICCALIVDL